MGRTIAFPALAQPRLAPATPAIDPAAPALDADTLCRSYSAYIAAISLRLLGRDHEVEDVVQDALAAALHDLPRLRGRDPATIRSWLASITVRIAWRRLRHRRLRALVGLDRAPHYDYIVAPGMSPEDRTLLAQVYTYLDEMPTKDRIAWTLRYVEKEPLDEVARLSGCSLATAKRRILAVNQALQRRLASAQHGPR